jgi:phosphoribosylaminoimidazolecarboxamide formyltransferase/IMP cyclohydrolase
METIKIGRALISVSDKRNILEFAGSLSALKVEIISTGGTAGLLRGHGLPVVEISAFTGHPEIMDGRVKTLHPKVHGGILAVRDNPLHIDQMAQNNIKPIDMVVVNLYPFVETVARQGVTPGEAIENIDIGGPAMVRSAAKNHRFVAVIVDPGDYSMVAGEIEKIGGVTAGTRKRLAAKAFAHTASYDGAIAAYLQKIYREV